MQDGEQWQDLRSAGGMKIRHGAVLCCCLLVIMNARLHARPARHTSKSELLLLGSARRGRAGAGRADVKSGRGRGGLF